LPKKSDFYKTDDDEQRLLHKLFPQTSLLPECRCIYPANDLVFMQDSARAKATRDFLRNVPDFISTELSVSSLVNAPLSSELNPLDSVWDILEELAYEVQREPTCKHA